MGEASSLVDLPSPLPSSLQVKVIAVDVIEVQYYDTTFLCTWPVRFFLCIAAAVM